MPRHHSAAPTTSGLEKPDVVRSRDQRQWYKVTIAERKKLHDLFVLNHLSCICRWKIDGFTQAGGHSPSTLTIVIALDSIRPLEVDLLGDSGLSATGNSGSEGQLVLFPGSHTLLQPLIRENVSEMIVLSDAYSHI
jgi:hypothetical protein